MDKSFAHHLGTVEVCQSYAVIVGDDITYFHNDSYADGYDDPLLRATEHAEHVGGTVVEVTLETRITQVRVVPEGGL